ncbi:MAG: two-component system response regulator [Candidatus Hydrothermarchaeota archaeon]|nr:MAG: two-component system response regulator [Candidatus Hydrothermarchaeota archaeon]
MRIMVVDDEPDILFLIEKFLEMEGYGVIKIGSGEECLEKVKDIKPDVILLDVMMPGLDGWEVSRKLKEDEETKDIPVILVTVRTSKESMERGLEYAKCDAYVGKPIIRDELINKIKWVIENK